MAHVQIYNRIIAPKIFGELISDIGTGLIANVEKRIIIKKIMFIYLCKM